MKKFLSVVLAFLMLAVMLPTTALASETTLTYEEGKTTYDLSAGIYTTYNTTSFQGKTVVFEGADKTTTTFVVGRDLTKSGEYAADYSLSGASVTFKNLTINLEKNKNYMGLIRPASLTFENCIIDGRGSYWGVGAVVFKNCTFNDTGDYNLWLYSGSSFTFDNCTFNSSVGKFINAYKEMTHEEQNAQSGREDSYTKVDFTGCAFKTDNANKPAICLKSNKANAWNLSFESCDVEDCAVDATSGNKYYLIEANGQEGYPEETTVKVENTVLWENSEKTNNDPPAPPTPPTDGPTVIIITPSADTPKTDDQKNPSTGANDMVAAAAALMAVAALGMSILSRKK